MYPLSLVISVVYTVTFWTYLHFDIIDYLTIGYLLVSSIRIFVMVFIVTIGAILGVLVVKLGHKKLEKWNKRLIKPFLVFIPLVFFLYLIYVSDNRVLVVAVAFFYFISIAVGNKFLEPYMMKRIGISVIKKVEEKSSVKIDDIKRITDETIKEEFKWIENVIGFVFLLIGLVVIPFIMAQESAESITNRENYSYVKKSSLKDPNNYFSERIILLGKIGDNYFFQPDSTDVVLIKKEEDFINLEIYHVHQGDSLSSYKGNN